MAKRWFASSLFRVLQSIYFLITVDFSLIDSIAPALMTCYLAKCLAQLAHVCDKYGSAGNVYKLGCDHVTLLLWLKRINGKMYILNVL